MKNEIQTISGNIAAFYAETGNYRQAYDLQQLKFQFWDSIFSAKSETQINDLKIKYGTLEKEKENVELESEASLLRQQ